MSADNFDKKPDNSINQDEELTAILQRLSSLLDKSVSLDDAIELAKKQSDDTDTAEESAETDSNQQTDVQEDAVSEQTENTVAAETSLAEVLEEDETEEIDAYAELIQKKLAASLETQIDTNTQDTLLDEEKSEENFIVIEEPIIEVEEPIVEVEEPIIEVADSDTSDKNMPVSDFIKLLKSKRFTEEIEHSEEIETDTDEPQIEEELPNEEPVLEEQAPVVEELRPIEQSTIFDAPTTETEHVKEVLFDDENELIDEKKPLFDTTTTDQEENIEEESETSKIFDEFLACFEERNTTENSYVSDDNTAEENEINEETPEPQTDFEEFETEEQQHQEPEEDEEISEFIPIEHESPEEDELFSKIFSEEKSERKNRERDKKKWQAPGDAPSPFLSGLYDWLEVIVLSAAFALLLFTFILRLAIVDGDSMNHTLHDQELLIISSLMYTPENSDIIVFTSPNYPEPIVKRIIATEGQTVDIDFDTWTVTVDGKVVEEDYINRVPGAMRSADVSFPLTVPEGYIFVMGDNRNDSLDSRNSRIGFVDERHILGEVKLRIFPFDRFGTID